MTLSIDSTIVGLGSRNDNVVTRQQLIAANVNSHAIQRRIGTVLTPFSRGVYIVGLPTRPALLRAALEATPSGAAADLTAAGLLDLPAESSPQIHLVSPHGVTRSFDDLRSPTDPSSAGCRPHARQGLPEHGSAPNDL